MKIIIAGAGEVGFHLAKLLSFESHDITLIDNKKSKSKTNIPVTVRQLEAIIRLSESIAKMTLSNFVTEEHVNEAHRLFKISTLSAATAKFNTVTDIPTDMAPIILKIEESIKRRLAIGAKVPYSKIIQELLSYFF